MSTVTPYLDSSVVSCGPMQPVLENGWSILPAPVPAPVIVPTQPYFALGTQLFPSQQLAAMVPAQPFSIVVQAQPELSRAVYANQIEVELGSRNITLPSNDFIDVEQLEHQLGAASPSQAGGKAEKKPKKPKRKQEDKEVVKTTPPAAKEGKSAAPQVKQTLTAITEGIAQVFNSTGKAAIPAGELKDEVDKVAGYSTAIETYARAGTFKPAKNCGAELAAFIQLIKAKIDPFFVELEAPFTVRRVEKAVKAVKAGKVEKTEKLEKEKRKKWVPAATTKPVAESAPAEAPSGPEGAKAE
eukprot:GGOE01020360.1.p1 GENE.GGOE01020360.1~~GGOE01020360.1.p1  ORF type:complete len:312 (-),score=107.31 GGOE01020360.1:714-1610(-)